MPTPRGLRDTPTSTYGARRARAFVIPVAGVNLGACGLQVTFCAACSTPMSNIAMRAVHGCIISSDAWSGLLGVLVGGGISGAVQFFSSEADRKQEFRLAALERRLQAHQEAYAFWRRLLFADKRNGEIHEVVIKAQEWWEQNCLYLTSDARWAFQQAYLAAHDHAELLNTHADAGDVKDAAEKVRRAGDVIVKGVNLPSIGEMESRKIESAVGGGDA